MDREACATCGLTHDGYEVALVAGLGEVDEERALLTGCQLHRQPSLAAPRGPYDRRDLAGLSHGPERRQLLVAAKERAPGGRGEIRQIDGGTALQQTLFLSNLGRQPIARPAQDGDRKGPPGEPRIQHQRGDAASTATGESDAVRALRSEDLEEGQEPAPELATSPRAQGHQDHVEHHVGDHRPPLLT